jgi:hypothetical protein
MATAPNAIHVILTRPRQRIACYVVVFVFRSKHTLLEPEFARHTLSNVKATTSSGVASFMVEPMVQEDTSTSVNWTVATTLPLVSVCDRFRVFKCLPVVTSPNSNGLHASKPFLIVKVDIVAFPVPAPPLALPELVLEAPQDQLRALKAPAPADVAQASGDIDTLIKDWGPWCSNSADDCDFSAAALAVRNIVNVAKKRDFMVAPRK